MGNTEIKHKAWVAITADDPEELKKILKERPDLLNAPISDDKKTNALTRAAYLDRPYIISLLITLGADINCTAESGISALMWACAKGNIESMKVILKFGADPGALGPFKMTAADFGVLHGAYNTVLYLYNLGHGPTKTVVEYLEIKKSMKTAAVDYKKMLQTLELKTPAQLAPFFVIPMTANNSNQADLNNIQAPNTLAFLESKSYFNKILPMADKSVPEILLKPERP